MAVVIHTPHINQPPPHTQSHPTKNSMGGQRFYVRGYDDDDFPPFGALTGATLEARLPLMLMASGGCGCVDVYTYVYVFM